MNTLDLTFLTSLYVCFFLTENYFGSPFRKHNIKWFTAKQEMIHFACSQVHLNKYLKITESNN